MNLIPYNLNIVLNKIRIEITKFIIKILFIFLKFRAVINITVLYILIKFINDFIYKFKIFNNYFKSYL